MRENSAGSLPLFHSFPELKERIPYIRLGEYPSPVQRLQSLEDGNVDALYIKRDDQCSSLYSSNKLRKLEFILADSLEKKKNNVLTVGYAGSNHSLATTIYAKQLGLKCTSLLMGQANAHYVRKNLLTSSYFQGDLYHYKNLLHLSLDYLRQMISARRKYGCFPLQIPAGGSSPLGVLGYVNAAFEIHEQIRQNNLPQPDVIYVTLGSTGTMLGLMLGFRVLGLKIRVVGVRAVGPYLAPERNMVSLFNRTAKFLHSRSSYFPRIIVKRADLSVRNDSLGRGYAHFTSEGQNSAKLLYEKYGIVLNGSYTAKTFSTLMGDARKKRLQGKVVLFWNTYNSCDLGRFTSGVEYTELPAGFHRYFEEDVQPLDKDGYDK